MESFSHDISFHGIKPGWAVVGQHIDGRAGEEDCKDERLRKKIIEKNTKRPVCKLLAKKQNRCISSASESIKVVKKIWSYQTKKISQRRSWLEVSVHMRFVINPGPLKVMQYLYRSQNCSKLYFKSLFPMRNEYTDENSSIEKGGAAKTV